MIAALSALLDTQLHAIQSVEIVPLETPAGQPFFYEAGHLGLPFSAVLPLASELHALWDADGAVLPSLTVTRLSVLVNGQHARAWGARKRMLQQVAHDSLHSETIFIDELTLTGLVLQVCFGVSLLFLPSSPAKTKNAWTAASPQGRFNVGSSTMVFTTNAYYNASENERFIVFTTGN